MKKNQLPKQVLNTLLAYQIKSDDILDVCPFDLSFDSEYISGYVLDKYENRRSQEPP